MGLSKKEKEIRKNKRVFQYVQMYHKTIDGVLYKLCKYKNHWVEMNKDNFYKNNTNSIDGYSPNCKKCDKEKSFKWRKDNPEKFKKQRKKERQNPALKEKTKMHNKKRRDNGKYYEWLANNPDKVFKYRHNRNNKIHNITKQEWENCKKYFNYSCAYCGLKIEDHFRTYKKKPQKIDLHKEHVDREGSNDLSNCVPSCQSCNEKKWTFLLEDWYNKDNPNFLEDRLIKIYRWLNKDYKEYINNKI